MVYIATEENEAFLGHSPIDDIAKHIVTSQGPSGTNIEYLIELHRALTQMPTRHTFDPHIEALVMQIRRIITSDEKYKSLQKIYFKN